MSAIFGPGHWISKPLQSAVADILASPSAAHLTTATKYDVELAAEMAFDVVKTKDVYVRLLS
jgi:hypothetical protein